MATKILTGKKYFYAKGQSARAKGLTKDQGTALYGVNSAQPYAAIYFDKGYRGLPM